MRAASPPTAGAPYLAFDTSGPLGSVAVGRGTDVLARATLTERLEQAAQLVPAIDHVLEAAGLCLAELEGVLVGEGPGSFTGVRVAAATAKGLSHALSLPLWAVSSLLAAALAHEVGPIRYALFDARSDRVYGACYGIGSAGVQELIAPHAGRLRDVLDQEVPGGAVFVGDASQRHRAVIEGGGYAVGPKEGSGPLADGLLRYLTLHPDASPISSLFAWEPRYLRGWRADPSWTG